MELDLEQFELLAEEKIEHIAVPSHLKFNRTIETGVEPKSGHQKFNFGMDLDNRHSLSCDEDTDHFLDMQNSENSTKIFLSDIELR